jgi:hypothetical protein
MERQKIKRIDEQREKDKTCRGTKIEKYVEEKISLPRANATNKRYKNILMDEFVFYYF